MAGDEARELVLVTGGAGFLAGWTIAALLKAGYRVRATLRSFAREAEVRTSIGGETDPGDRLTFAEANLLSDAGWDRAAEGATFVLHVASPMQIGEFRDQDVIRPAREGTLRVLKAAAKAGARRTVITSSTQAAVPAKPAGDPVDENTWTDLSQRGATDYTRAKTLAEQDAWSFAAQNPAMAVAAVLPVSIQGPIMGPDVSGSVEIIRRLLKGRVGALPRIGFSIVDVRDLADLHLRAMTMPEAAGQRFIGSGDFLWFAEIAGLLRARLGDGAQLVPTKMAPDLLIRLSALFQKELRQLTHGLGRKQSYSSAKALRVLGWKGRPAEASIMDAAQSLIRGWDRVSGALTFSAVLDVEPIHEDEFLALITPVLDAMRSETTFISATFARDAIVPHRFLLFEQWADRALFLDVEMKRPYRTAYLSRLSLLLARPRQVTEWVELRSDHALQTRPSG